MKELLIAIVDFGDSRQFFVVPVSCVNTFLDFCSQKNLGRYVTVIFQQALEYEPEAFQKEFDKLNNLSKSIKYGNN